MHTITGKAYDDIENVGEAAHGISIDPSSGIVIDEVPPFGFSDDEGGPVNDEATGTVLSVSSVFLNEEN